MTIIQSAMIGSGSIGVSSTTAAAPGIYVDSVAGSDSNAGTSSSPFATAGKALAVLGATSTVTTNIWLKCGSTFYESFCIPTNSRISSYGTGSKPLFTGATNLANASFTLTAGKTNTYQIPLQVPYETNKYSSYYHSNVLMVWQNDKRLGARWDQNASYDATPATAIAKVDGNTNSFYYYSASNILYLNPGTNGNPATNGLAYAASIRTLGLNGGDGFGCTNIAVEKAYAFNSLGLQGYQILGWGSGRYLKCTAQQGWNHVMGLAVPHGAGDLYFDSCMASDAEDFTYAAQSTIVVSYRDGTGNVIFTNCTVFQPKLNANLTAFTGFYTHDGGGGSGVSTYYLNCSAFNVYSGFAFGAARNFGGFSGCTAQNCVNGFSAAWEPVTVIGFNSYSCTWGIKANAGNSIRTVTVNGSKFFDNVYPISICALATNCYITNSIFTATNTTAKGYAIASSGTYCNISSVSNSFNYMNRAYDNGQMTNSLGTAFSDYNNYYGWVTIAASQVPSPGYWTDFSTWKTVWPNIDTHSTTVDPGYSTNLALSVSIVDPSL